MDRYANHLFGEFNEIYCGKTLEVCVLWLKSKLIVGRPYLAICGELFHVVRRSLLPYQIANYQHLVFHSAIMAAYLFDQVDCSRIMFDTSQAILPKSDPAPGLGRQRAYVVRR